MHRIQCSEVWGGIKNEDLDACSAVLTTSLFSSACDGGNGGDIYYVSVCQGDQLTRVAIADVVGHGEKVSQVSQWLYESLHERMNDGDGGQLLGHLNRLVIERGLEAMTTAATVGFYSVDAKAYFTTPSYVIPMSQAACQLAHCCARRGFATPYDGKGRVHSAPHGPR